MSSAIKAVLALAALAGGGALAAQGGGLAALAGLQRGKWTVTTRDGGTPQTLCLGNPVQLIQLRHPQRACSRLVVENEAAKLTVQYTCKGDGYGRTSIRRETPTLIQIESQGISHGRPFQFAAEGRRTGACR
ncbi:MAG: hypothetical protein JNJ92_05570 [Altererythrobacter sp.]|nr:hypothetical protein [Altererythrobacter sp.]